VGVFLLALVVLAIIAAALLGPGPITRVRRMTEVLADPELSVC